MNDAASIAPVAKIARPSKSGVARLMVPAVLLLPLVLSACGGDTATFCRVTKPLFPEGDDVLSDNTMREIIANEDARQQLCGRFDGHELFDLGLGQ